MVLVKQGLAFESIGSIARIIVTINPKSNASLKVVGCKTLVRALRIHAIQEHYKIEERRNKNIVEWIGYEC